MIKKFAPAVWETLFTNTELTSEPFEVAAGSIIVSREKKNLYYITPLLVGKKYKMGLGDVFNALGVKFPETLSLEEANALLTNLTGQFIKGELKPVTLKEEEGA